MKYKIISALEKDLSKMETIINNMLSKGWETTGGASSAVRAGSIIYTQALKLK